MSKFMPNIKTAVYYLLNNYPSTRNSDKRLLNRFIAEFYPEWDGDFEKIPSVESITRARRHLQEENPNLAASPKVSVMRQLKEEQIRYHQPSLFDFDEVGLDG